MSLARKLFLTGLVSLGLSCGSLGMLVISTGHQIQPGGESLFFGLIYLAMFVFGLIGPLALLLALCAGIWERVESNRDRSGR